MTVEMFWTKDKKNDIPLLSPVLLYRGLISHGLVFMMMIKYDQNHFRGLSIFMIILANAKFQFKIQLAI